MECRGVDDRCRGRCGGELSTRVDRRPPTDSTPPRQCFMTGLTTCPVARPSAIRARDGRSAQHRRRLRAQSRCQAHDGGRRVIREKQPGAGARGCRGVRIPPRSSPVSRLVDRATEEVRVAEERSVSDVLQDILRNLQEMVRSEIRLAKVEIRGEVKRAVSSGVWIAAGGVGRDERLDLPAVDVGLRTRDPDVDVGGNADRSRRDGRCCGGAHHGWHSEGQTYSARFRNGRWNRSRRISNG